MIITLLLLFLIIQECKHVPKSKKTFIFLLSLLYLIYCIFDLVYLNVEFDRSFHFSDPSNYFEYASNASSFKEIINIGKNSSNIFYCLLNYIYLKIYYSPLIISIIVRLNNIALSIYIYLLITQTSKKITVLDYILMLNPFLFIVIARNVRDLYILLFIVLLLLSFKILPSVRYYPSKIKYWTIAIMMTLRPICLIPLFIILLIKYTKKYKYLRFLIFVSLFIVAYIYKDYMLKQVMGQFISAANYIGEESESYIALYDGDLSNSALIPFISRLAKAFVSLIFTPHPLNFAESWIGVDGVNGIYGIYTKLDCLMINLGAIISYCFIIPRIITLLITKEAYKYESFLYAVIYSVIYVTAYLGITDIRNHYVVYVLFIIPMFSQLSQVKVPIKIYITVGIFLILLTLIN